MKIVVVLVLVVVCIGQVVGRKYLEDSDHVSKRHIHPAVLYSAPPNHVNSRVTVNRQNSQAELIYGRKPQVSINQENNSPNPHNPIYTSPLCKTPASCLNPNNLPKNVSRAFLSGPRVLYATVASCWGYAQLANIHLGRPVRSESELEGMCPTQLWSGTGYFGGFGTQFQKRCISAPDSGFVCVNVPGTGDSGTDLNIQTILTSYLVGTDEKSYALFYRCVDNRYADYVVLSGRPFLEQSTAQQAINQILALGFPESEVRVLPCKAPTSQNPTGFLLQNFGKK